MSFLPTLFLIIVPAIFGTAVFAALRLFREKIILLLTGAISGLSLTIFLTYFTTAVFPLSNITLLAILLILVAITALLLIKTSAWANWRACHLDKTTLIIFAALAVLSILIAPKLLITMPDGSLHTGVLNAYGDIGWHMSNITSLQNNNSFVPQNPIFASTPLTYPFLTNFFSTMLLETGATLSRSITMPTLLLFTITLVLIYCFALKLTGKKIAAAITLLLFLFAGGTVGWIQIFGDWQESSGTLINFLSSLPRHYTGHSDNPLQLHLINPLISLLLPQRSFLFGIPLALTLLLLLLQTKSRGTPALITAGVLAGILPLFHAHTVLTLVPAILGLLIIYPAKKWLYFFFTAGLIGIPGLLIYQAGSSSFSSLFKLQLGWMSSPDNFFIYWIKNTGLIIPATMLAIILPAPRATKALAIAGFVIFIAANIWLFAAWEWDNTKLFVYWLLFSLPLVSYLLVKLFRSSSLALRGVIIAFFIFHTLSGALDVFQLALPNSPTWQVWSKHDVDFAQEIRANTQLSDTIITAPIHNSTVALTGRPQYLGYPGHVWTHGGNHWNREAATRQFYEGKIDTLPETTVTHVLVGPAEKSMYPSLKIRPDWQLVIQQNGYVLYKLRQ
ncbi:MAG: hypothetical protein ABIH36_02840 [bacterium]